MADTNLLMGRGTHACHFFETLDEQEEVLLKYFDEGLRKGEACVYITCDQPVQFWRSEFLREGLKFGWGSDDDALTVLTGDEWRGNGRFNSILKAREAWVAIEKLLDRHPGVRVAGDAAWALKPLPLPTDALCHWEATANLVYEDEDVMAICQYDLNRHSPAAIHSALRTHQVVIFEGQAFNNPYYEAPKILASEPELNHSSNDPQLVEVMLDTLRTMQAAGAQAVEC